MLRATPVVTALALCLTTTLAHGQTPAAPKPAPKAPGVTAAAPRTPTARPAARAAAPVSALTDEQKTLYAIGLLVHRSLAPFDLAPAELELIVRAVRDAQTGKPGVQLDEWGPKVQTLAGARAGRVTAREKVASAAFLTKAASAIGAVRTDTGIVYTELTAGAGASPQASDRVRVHYRGTLTNGTEFDSSYARNEPAEFPLGGVIKCWTEGVQRMKVGGKARLVCPSDLAYGDAGNSAIPGGSALVFEVELLGIVEAEPAAP